MSIGKEYRLKRIMDIGSRNFLIVPMDHGITTGPVRGLEDMRQTFTDLILGGATGVLFHKGLARVYTETLRDFWDSEDRRDIKLPGMIIHLNASTNLSPNRNKKTLITTVEEAVSLGADAVSFHINVGSEYEHIMLEEMGAVGREASRLGVPLLAMMYPRGAGVKNPFEEEMVAHAVRVGVEMGADIVKTYYTGNIETFSGVVGKSCGVPVIIAGGEKLPNQDAMFRMVKDSMEAGGRGISIGRNVFQGENRRELVSELGEIIFSM